MPPALKHGLHDDHAMMSQHADIPASAHHAEHISSSRTDEPPEQRSRDEALVKAHGGCIEVSSRVGEGTTLTILLPMSPDGVPKPQSTIP